MAQAERTREGSPDPNFKNEMIHHVTVNIYTKRYYEKRNSKRFDNRRAKESITPTPTSLH